MEKMTDKENMAYIRGVIKIIENAEHSLEDVFDSGLVECDNGNVLFLYNASDLYGWGYSCHEVFMPEDMNLLGQTVDDVRAAEGNEYGILHDVAILLDCRLNKERPQGAYYEYIYDYLVPLFDACGEERASGPGNPYTREEGMEKRREKKNAN